MRINLRTLSKQAKEEQTTLFINERLPSCCLNSPTLDCHYAMTAYDEYSLVHIKLSGALDLICQRCLASYRFDYTHEVVLAICASEKMADQLMPRYETLVASDNYIDLVEIATDELHLSIPTMHPNKADCDPETAHYIK